MAKAFILLRVLGIETTVVDLVSPLRRDECVRRLREHVDDKWNLTPLRPVFGQIDETSFDLRKRLGYRNSFRTHLRGTLVEESRRTGIRCRIGIDPLVRAIMLVWLGIMALVACAFAATGIALLHGRSPTAGSSLGQIIFPVLMLGFGIAIVKVGRYLARGEQQYLLDFLARYLDARAAPGE